VQREDLTEEQRDMTPGFNGPVWEQTEASGKIEPNLKEGAAHRIAEGNVGDCPHERRNSGGTACWSGRDSAYSSLNGIHQ